jgi:hypothetical protein
VTENQRGRHRSSDKEGKKTIALLKSVPGVTAVLNVGETVEAPGTAVSL